ncbi:hypothetical protein MUN76_15170 [Leucobacter rhizosphaerae]|uniref:Uncharacterized protein n=1 Tax=Leucobacter rhizosphaerae TaxID=2932245 RepID=A0ABY4FVL1_9MICO|nr:hypothetical protein [Leucobacter rhizosphaerae]UOQ60350.1 hypothetical protein MUN76_15170 [Leucobacter rhizosphaerae]
MARQVTVYPDDSEVEQWASLQLAALLVNGELGVLLREFVGETYEGVIERAVASRE